MITVLDTVTPSTLPHGDFAYAGYVGGHFADAGEIERMFPHAHVLTYAVHPDEKADMADLESGDFPVSQPQVTVNWVLKMHQEGVWRPGIYASLNTFQTTSVLKELSKRLPRNMYRLEYAEWNGQRVIRPGFDGHQLADHGPHGENFDVSVVLDNFFNNIKHVKASMPKPVAEVRYDPSKHSWAVRGVPFDTKPLGK